MDYLLIDSNNLAIRAAFANSELRNGTGVPSGVHYGVLQSLVNLRNMYPKHKILMIWDGTSARRVAEADAAVEKGLIPSGYKANREKDEQPQPLVDFRDQAPYLKKGLHQLGIPQVRYPEFEADDVAASYAKVLKERGEVVIVTSDRDYYQLLDTNVTLWDGMKLKQTTQKSWTDETGIDPPQHVDCGALSGDTGDNIFGIPGWGDKTALKEIKKHGNWKAVLDEYEKQFGKLRGQHPDIDISDEASFNTLASVKTEKGKVKYPQIYRGIPYSGVALAFERKEVKIPKSALMLLMFQDRLSLAYSLKKMDDDISGLPEIPALDFNANRLREYLDYYDIRSLDDELEMFDV